MDAVFGRFAEAGAAILPAEGGGMEIALAMVKEPGDDPALICLLTIGDIYLASSKQKTSFPGLRAFDKQCHRAGCSASTRTDRRRRAHNDRRLRGSGHRKGLEDERRGG